MQERRKFPRVTYPCKITVSIEEDREEFTLHTENISSGGARVIMQKQFKINTPVGIEIVIGERSIETKGRIVWVLEFSSPDKTQPCLFDTGIEFTHLNVDDREFLSKLIGQLLEQYEAA
ncbi:MAG: PilZ domain-containing protein [Candidatus Omnitrophica bacterium]|nr:PilZ domain-containing protein [Candidatus Omnitrophota bacterium]